MSGLYDIAHGASLSIVYPAWMEYVYSHDKKRFMQFAVRVWDVDLAYGEEDEICLEGIRRLRMPDYRQMRLKKWPIRQLMGIRFQ